jgi:hypothetical protein
LTDLTWIKLGFAATASLHYTARTTVGFGSAGEAADLMIWTGMPMFKSNEVPCETEDETETVQATRL